MTWQGTGQFRWSIGANGTTGTNRKGCHSNGSIGILGTLRDSNTILCTNAPINVNPVGGGGGECGQGVGI